MRNRPTGSLARILLIAFIALGVFIVVISRFSSGQTPPASLASVAQGSSPSRDLFAVTPSTPSPSPTATAVPTATPMPTATPIPAPVKVRDVAAPQVGAITAVVIDEVSGAVLYSKNSRTHRAPASITKIVTAIVAIERGKLDDMVTVRYDPDELVDSTVMGVNPGDQLTLEDLLYGLMLPSGNDAALAIANHIAGSREAFAALMNAKMTELGLTDSHFVNPHGLDEDEHYTTAYDMAMISRYAMGNATFRDLAKARLHAVTVRTRSGVSRYDVFNLNRLLNSYNGTDGIKIGFTDNALRTIVASATREGHRVYVALMGSRNLWADSPPLFDYAFKNFQWPGTITQESAAGGLR